MRISQVILIVELLLLLSDKAFLKIVTKAASSSQTSTMQIWLSSGQLRR